VKAAADGTMLSIIIFALAFGFATLAAPADVRRHVVACAHTLSTVMLIVVQAVLLIAPVGIFALTLVVGARVGGTVFAAMGWFIGVQIAFAAIVVLAMLALTVIWGRIPLGTAIRGVTPPLLVAAGTSSSLSALPAMIESARDAWTLPERIYGVVLPLAVSTFKPTSGYSWVVNVVFVATLYGVPFGPAQLALAAGYATLFNATIPGIPGGGMIAITPMLIALGLPVEGLAILIAVNPIVDRFTTIGNVAADLALTAILANASFGGQRDVD
jgi:Na+/H+-dicarboxylate symporter